MPLGERQRKFAVAASDACASVNLSLSTSNCLETFDREDADFSLLAHNQIASRPSLF